MASENEGNSHKDIREAVLKSMRTLGGPRLDVFTGNMYDVEHCIVSCDTNIPIIYAYTIPLHQI